VIDDLEIRAEAMISVELVLPNIYLTVKRPDDRSNEARVLGIQSFVG